MLINVLNTADGQQMHAIIVFFPVKQTLAEVITSVKCKVIITKAYVYNFDPLKPDFYIVKLGFTGVYIIFLISAQNIDCG